VPHRCKGASASAIHQIHAILHRAFAVAVKWRWMYRNPADFATRPRSARDDRDPPTPQDAVRLLEAAETYRPDLALWLWLLLVTGTRRGELCAIRWSDIDFAEQDLLIERAYAIRGGRKVIKPTKTHQRRRLALDPGIVELLAEYRELCGKRAAQVGGMLAADGYVFSSDGFGEQPWPPDTVTHWFKRVRAAAGVDCKLRSLRHYNATQMLAAGIDVRTAAGRLGHAGGGSMTLKVYAHRTRPADQRAAELLASELRARRSGSLRPSVKNVLWPGELAATAGLACGPSGGLLSRAGRLADHRWAERRPRRAVVASSVVAPGPARGATCSRQVPPVVAGVSLRRMRPGGTGRGG
jgi:integrase